MGGANAVQSKFKSCHLPLWSVDILDERTRQISASFTYCNRSSKSSNSPKERPALVHTHSASAEVLTGQTLIWPRAPAALGGAQGVTHEPISSWGYIGASIDMEYLYVCMIYVWCMIELNLHKSTQIYSTCSHTVHIWTKDQGH